MRYFYFIFFAGILHFFSAAQDIPVLRLELNARMSEDTYTLIPCQEQGVVVFYEGNIVSDGMRNLHFALFGQQLEEVWIKDTLLDDGYKYVDYFQDGEELMLLFHIESRKGKDDNNLQILSIGLKNSRIKLLNATIPEKSKIGGFAVNNGNAVISFTEKKYQAGLAFVNLYSGDFLIQPIEIQGQNVAGIIVVDSLNPYLYVMVYSFESKKQSKAYVVKIGTEGMIYEIMEINPVLEDKFINYAFPVPEGNDLYVVGTYSWFPNELVSDNEDNFPESAGCFMAKFRDGKQVFINFYNFLEFENLYKSMDGRDVIRIRKKAEKQKKRGEEVSLDYKVLLHPVMKVQNEFILACEAFYPEYRTVTDMYYDYYGRMVPQTYTVFDGYKYFAGIVVSFDKNGNLLWDNEMALWDLQTFDLEQYLQIHHDGEDNLIFYNKNGKIEYMIFDGNETIVDNEDLELKLKYDNDRLLNDARSKIVHWYDNFFLCYGYQEVRNNKLSGNRRMVFYVNKIALQ